MSGLLWGAAWIFLLRLMDVSIGTVRTLMVVRGRKGAAWATGFVTALVYIIAVRKVLTGDMDIYTLLGYAAGFATGNVLGMWMEERLAVGIVRLQIITPRHGQALAATLRAAGYAATEASGSGRDGTVSLLVCNVPRHAVTRVEQIASQVDDQAFITEQDMRYVQGGFMRARRFLLSQQIKRK